MVLFDGFESLDLFGPKVDLQGRVRWAADGSYFTSSGVTAGIDTRLAEIGRLLCVEAADHAATHCEYERQLDAGCDPFAIHFGVS